MKYLTQSLALLGVLALTLPTPARGGRWPKGKIIDFGVVGGGVGPPHGGVIYLEGMY